MQQKFAETGSGAEFDLEAGVQHRISIRFAAQTESDPLAHFTLRAMDASGVWQNAQDAETNLPIYARQADETAAEAIELLARVRAGRHRVDVISTAAVTVSISKA